MAQQHVPHQVVNPHAETNAYVEANAHTEHHHHVVDMKTLVGVFVWLLVLTVLTVAVTYVDLGPLNIWIALFIAVLKGAVVCLYFMHLRWDSPFNGVILATALLFLAVFIGGTIQDAVQYMPNLSKPGEFELKPRDDGN